LHWPQHRRAASWIPPLYDVFLSFSSTAARLSGQRLRLRRPLQLRTAFAPTHAFFDLPNTVLSAPPPPSQNAARHEPAPDGRSPDAAARRTRLLRGAAAPHARDGPAQQRSGGVGYGAWGEGWGMGWGGGQAWLRPKGKGLLCTRRDCFELVLSWRLRIREQD
jgi:hypothetical protein